MVGVTIFRGQMAARCRLRSVWAPPAVSVERLDDIVWWPDHCCAGSQYARVHVEMHHNSIAGQSSMSPPSQAGRVVLVGWLALGALAVPWAIDAQEPMPPSPAAPTTQPQSACVQEVGRTPRRLWRGRRSEGQP